MTLKRHWSILAALLLILSLFLVACVRPLPGDNETLPTATPAETGSGSQPETYSAPPAPELEDTPAGESYPAGEEETDSSADLLQPDNESETNLEGYPGDEAEVPEGETSEGEAVEGETTEGETAEGETTEGETPESEAAEGETTEGETAEGETTEGETPESEAAEGETTEGETAEGETAESSEGTEVIESGRTHTVAAGETLYSIGMQYGFNWVAIAEANGITNPDSLTIGQVLTIPDVSTTDTTESSDSSETSETTESTETTDDTVTAEETEVAEPDSVEEPFAEETHIVQSGENLYRISLKFGVSMMDIARANGLANFDQIYAGQELIIPQAETDEETAENNAEEKTHLVQEGETVFGIAFEYGIAWTKLVEANEIVSPYILEAGQSLLIPTGN